MKFISMLSRFADWDIARKGLTGGLLCLGIALTLAVAPAPFLHEAYDDEDIAIAAVGVLLSVLWLHFVTWRAKLFIRKTSPSAAGGQSSNPRNGRGALLLLAKTLDRWPHQMEVGLRRLTEGKTFGHRLGGDLKTDRVEAKYLLLALAPALLFSIWDRAHSVGTVIWYASTSITLAWYIFIVPLMFTGFWRWGRSYWLRRR